jgi:TolB-like protein/Tfp pilus assembly protein PilF/tRNA A-37 threonylcarbamoyl transferase component Bud32
MARMSQLLEEALPLDEAGRRAWLEHLPPAHADLSAALRRSLFPGDAECARADALEAPLQFGAGMLKPGTRLGPYELLRRLGSGGMAEVWLARRADGAFKRDVALKVPMLAQLRQDLEQRFMRERDIVASLEHPNIARLYDAGVDAGGLPYLSMEYVHGQPLTDYCDTHGLEIARRLELLLQVLDAVQYAHQRAVVHRDLKPSNILVMQPGQVRLLDFGIAKLLNADSADEVALTRVYGRALTADYASPELLRGDVVDERSDIYSLGVLLHELLTGVRPYRLKNAASMGMLDQALATLEVGKPSALLQNQAAGSRKMWARQLRGDLDAITLKALAKDPAERYQSAAALSADLRRFLAGEPIQAHPAGVAYRFGKFVRRNRTVAAVSAAALTAVLGAAAYTSYRSRIARPPPEDRAAAHAPAPASLASAASDPAARGAFTPPENSVAVLPFLDSSEKRDQEYFSDGLAEELLDLLANIPGLHVTARTSSFSFKGKSDDIAAIARKLNVANILEGSVQKSGNRIRVVARLIKSIDGEGIWSATFDRQIKDVFQVQDEIAGAVVAALKVKLAPGRPVIAAHRTSNINAYNEVLLARQFFDRFTLEGFRLAVGAYRRATQLDPGYAAAYAELAMSEFFAADWTNDSAGRQRALQAADKAVALAPDQAEGYAARGHIRVNGQWDWSGARADFENALKLDPSNSVAMRRYALLLATLGDAQESIAMTQQAIDLDPLSGVTWANLGLLLLGDGKMSAAHDAIHRAVEIQPESSYALTDLLDLQLLEGHFADVPETARRHGGEEFSLKSTAMAEYSLSHSQASRQALDELTEKFAKDCAFCIATASAWCGQIDATFKWLEQAFEQRESDVVEIKYDPIFRSLRGDPRFKALLRKMNLPEE